LADPGQLALVRRRVSVRRSATASEVGARAALKARKKVMTAEWAELGGLRFDPERLGSPPIAYSRSGM
jgi:hypothetical protein